MITDTLTANNPTAGSLVAGNLAADTLTAGNLTDWVIHTQALEKTFKDLPVLKGVDLQVQRGEIFALLGSNGAGKTTTINILSTLMRPTGGTAQVCGYNVVKQPQKVRQCISLTGQFAAVDTLLTGRENLRLIAQLRGVPQAAQLTDSLLERFDLTQAADRRAEKYSGGMRRKLDIAMSLIGTPQVIFLDEPTTGLDPQGRLDVWDTVKGLANSGTTILLTTQNLEEAQQLANRIAILHEGRIIACGTFEQLKALFPPAKVEYVEKQPSLEEIFLAITNKQQPLQSSTPQSPPPPQPSIPQSPQAPTPQQAPQSPPLPQSPHSPQNKDLSS